MRRILVGAFKITEEEKRAVNEVLDSGRISERPGSGNSRRPLTSISEAGTRWRLIP